MTKREERRSVPVHLALAALALAGACTHFQSVDYPSLTGRYLGTAVDGTVLEADVIEDGVFSYGHGSAGTEPFAFSVPGPWRGPAAVAFAEGAAGIGGFAISTSGVDLALPGREPVPLAREGATVAVPIGAFAGRFASRRTTPVSLTLTQRGDLLAGRGSLLGRPVAVVGRTEPDDTAGLTLLFTDASRLELQGGLSRSGRRLTLRGLGEDVVLARQGGGSR